MKYKLIVLSRNLTFDRSWDLATSIDGQLTQNDHPPHPGLCDFVKSFLPHAPDFSFLVRASRELPRVKWSCPDNFYNLRMLPGGGAHLKAGEDNFGRPIDFSSRVDDLLVMAPFVDAKENGGLAWLAAQANGERYLFSRAEELNRIGPEALKNWHCFSLNSDAVDGEEKLEQSGAEPQNLHAKLIVSKNGKTSHWHLGSANASSAALGEMHKNLPRNSEFMIRLTGQDSTVGPSILVDSLVADDRNGLFVSHTFSKVEPEDTSINENAIRRLVHDIVSKNWQMKARVNNNSQFDVSLEVEQGVSIPEGLNVTVALLCQSSNEKELAIKTVWPDIPLTNISAFLPVRISTDDGVVHEQLVIQASLEIVGGDNRASHVLRSLVDTEKKFINYIRLLLQTEPNKDQWFSMELTPKGIGDEVLIDFEQPIFEQMMLAASRRPDQLIRIDLLVSRLHKLGALIPDDFLSLWQHFKPLVPKNNDRRNTNTNR